jgi:hypothetical protein
MPSTVKSSGHSLKLIDLQNKRSVTDLVGMLLRGRQCLPTEAWSRSRSLQKGCDTFLTACLTLAPIISAVC